MSNPASVRARLIRIFSGPSLFLLGVLAIQLLICISLQRSWSWSWRDSALLAPEVAQRTFSSSWQLLAFATPITEACDAWAKQLFPEHFGTLLYALNVLGLGAAGMLTLVTFVDDRAQRKACVPLLGLVYAASFPVFAMQSGSLLGVGAGCFFAAGYALKHPRGQAAVGALYALALLIAPPFAVALPAFFLLTRMRAWLAFGTVACVLLTLNLAGWSETAARYGSNWHAFFFTSEKQAQTVFLGALFDAVPSYRRYGIEWLFVAGKFMGPLLLVPDLLLLVRLRAWPAAGKESAAAKLFALSLPAVCLLPFGSHAMLLCLCVPLLPVMNAVLTNDVARGKILFWITLAVGAALAGVHFSGEFSLGFLTARAPLLGILLFGAAGVFLKLGVVSSTIAMPWLDKLNNRCREHQAPTPLHLLLQLTAANPAIGIPLGISLWIGCLAVYFFYGFSWGVVAVWFFALLSIFCVWEGLNLRWRDLAEFSISDFKYLAVLAVLFFPVYVWASYAWPYQIVTDELSFSGYIKLLMNDRHYDFFRVSREYFCWPAGCFVFLGAATYFLGGSSIETIRTVNGALGLVAIAGIYMLGRHIFCRRHAFYWALLFGVSHAFVTISRMALRDTIPVLLEIIALVLLYRGIRRRNNALLFLTGVVAGLGVYNYFSGRVVIVISSAVLAYFVWRETLGVAFAHRIRTILWRGLPLFSGFLLCAGPMAISTLQAGSQGSLYTREQCLLFAEARQAVTDWHPQHSTFWAIVENAFNGLAIFNNNQFDNSYAYVNLKHGFVDPLTGVLIWVGVLFVLWAKRKGQFRQMVLGGFLIIWLVVGCLMTRNPAYCRFLVIMPFATFAALEGGLLLGRRASDLLRLAATRRMASRFVFLLLLGIAGWNAKILHDHYRQGAVDGDEVASTIRYVRDRADNDYHTFYIVTDDNRPFQPYGGDFWRMWISTQLPANCEVSIVRPSEIEVEPRSFQVPKGKPCVVLMNGETWKKNEEKWRKDFPGVNVTSLTPKGTQWGLEFNPKEQVLRLALDR